MSEQQDIIVGIDLGTTNSLVAVCDEAGPRILRDASGEGRMPSFMTFGTDGRITVGWQAKEHAVENPTSTVYSIKRLMGRGFDELAGDGELAQLPYKVVKRAAGEAGRDIAGIELDGRLLTPPELSAIILRELKERASSQLGREVRKAIITVPAYFDDAQRQATRDAGRIAGLEVVRIINEPTAAALAYGLGIRGQLEQEHKAARSGGSSLLPLAGACPSGPQCGGEAHPAAEIDSVIAVYDLGGGTFDVSVLRIVDDVFEVLSTHGNTRLGGDDLDREIIHLFEREIHEQFGLDIGTPTIRQAMRTLAENIKIRLSNETSAAVEIDLGEGRKYNRTLTRAEFEAMILPWVEKTIASCRRALADAHIETETIDQVVLVGGEHANPAGPAAGRGSVRAQAVHGVEPR